MTLKNHHILPIIFLALVVSACSMITDEQTTIVKQDSDSELHLTGEALYNERCRECHRTQGRGEEVGSDLANMPKKGDRAYLELVIRDPLKVYGPDTMMPAGDDLSDKQVKSLVDYIQTLK